MDMQTFDKTFKLIMIIKCLKMTELDDMSYTLPNMSLVNIKCAFNISQIEMLIIHLTLTYFKNFY